MSPPQRRAVQRRLRAGLYRSVCSPEPRHTLPISRCSVPPLPTSTLLLKNIRSLAWLEDEWGRPHRQYISDDAIGERKKRGETLVGLFLIASSENHPSFRFLIPHRFYLSQRVLETRSCVPYFGLLRAHFPFGLASGVMPESKPHFAPAARVASQLVVTSLKFRRCRREADALLIPG